MRRILPVLVLFAVAACGLPETRWEKEGADEKLTAGDLTYCRKAARDEAFRVDPFGTYSPYYGFRRWALFNDNRQITESQLTDFCMRNKGYQLVTVTPPQATPPTAPTTEK